MPNVAAALFGRGSVYALVTVLQSFSFFFVLPVLSRQLGPREYGVVVTSVVAFQLLLVIAPLGLSSVVAWDLYERLPDGLDRSRRLAASTWLIAIAVVLAVDLTGPIWASVLQDVPYRGALRIAVLTAIPGAALAICQGFLQAQGRALAFSACTLSSVVLGQLLGVVVVLGGGGAAGYLAGAGVGASVGGALGFVLVGIRPWRLVGLARVRVAFAHGGPTVLHSASFIFLASGDRILIERMLGLREAGRYHVAYLVGGAAMSVVQALNNAWAPLVFSAKEEDRWPLLAATSAMISRLSLYLAGGVALAGPLPLMVLVPSEFDPTSLTAACAIVGLCVVPSVTYFGAAQVLFQHRRTSVLAWTTPAAGIANLAFNVALIPLLGLVGSALATLLSYLLWAALVRRAAGKLQRVEWHRKTELVSYASAGALAVLGALLPTTTEWIIVRGVVSTALLVLLVRLLLRLLRTTVHLEASGTAGFTAAQE